MQDLGRADKIKPTVSLWGVYCPNRVIDSEKVVRFVIWAKTAGKLSSGESNSLTIVNSSSSDTIVGNPCSVAIVFSDTVKDLTSLRTSGRKIHRVKETKL